jgi:hypothetical protein
MLRPFEDLIHSSLENDKTPIIEIIKILGRDYWIEGISLSSHKDFACVRLSDNILRVKKEFRISRNYDLSFFCFSINKYIEIPNQLLIFKFLHEHQFIEL